MGEASTEHSILVSDWVTMISQVRITSFRVSAENLNTGQYSAKISIAAHEVSLSPYSSGQPLSVTLKTDKPTYNNCDHATFSIDLSQSAYVYVFSIGSDLSVRLLYPMKKYDLENGQGKLVKHLAYPTREEQMSTKFNLEFPPGVAARQVKESVLVLATTGRWIDFSELGIPEADAEISTSTAFTEIARALDKAGLYADQVIPAQVDYKLSGPYTGHCD